MRLSSSARRLLLIVLLVWISAGCYVPIKPPQSPFSTSREYFPATRKDFTVGETSRAGVLLTMGEPDEKALDESLLTYKWFETIGVIGIACGIGGEVIKTTTYKFTFDTNGTLKKLDISFDD